MSNFVIGMDLETNCLNPFDDDSRILTSAFASEVESYGVHEDSWQLESIIKKFNREDVIMVGHNILLFDWYWLYVKYGIWPKCYIFDTQIAYSLIDENERNSLEVLSKKLLGKEKYKEEINRRQMEVEYFLDPEKVLRYNISDAELSYELYEPILSLLLSEGMDDLYEFVIEYSMVLLKMMSKGIRLDVEWTKNLEQELLENMSELEALFKKVAGERFNINSHEQLSDLLFNKLRFPVQERSKKTQKPSTGFESLMMLRDVRGMSSSAIKFIDKILEYRKHSKVLTGFVQPLMGKEVKNDGRVHASYNVGRRTSDSYSRGESGARTGRLSSSGPNMQNVPRDIKMRGCFLPSPGFALFSADYRQLELRIAAWEAKEESLLEVFNSGGSPHVQTLALLKGITYEQAEAFKEAGGHDEYVVAKTVNFLALYGGGPYRLRQTLFQMGIYKSYAECASILDRWFNRLPYIKVLFSEWEDTVCAEKVITNAIGRKRRLPAASRNTKEGQHAIRQAINFRIQSLAGEITNRALVELDRELPDSLLITVHDSVVGEYSDGEDCSNIVEDCMTNRTSRFFESEYGLVGLPLAVDIQTNLERWQ